MFGGRADGPVSPVSWIDPMGLFDRLTGTGHPETGVAPLPATELRAALLAFTGPDVPYRVRDGLPEDYASTAVGRRPPGRGATGGDPTAAGAWWNRPASARRR